MADMEKIQAILATLNAAAAAKSAKKEEPKDDHKAAFGKAADLATKAHKAVGDLNEHLQGMAKDKAPGASGLAEDGEKVHKSMKALHGDCHKAAGMEPKASEGDGESEKTAFGDAMKAIGMLTAKIESLEKAAYQPRAAGPGVVTATKGAALEGVVAHKAIGDMSEDERDEARKAALARSKQMPIAADEFAKMGQDSLRAADKVLQLAGQSGEVAQ